MLDHTIKFDAQAMPFRQVEMRVSIIAAEISDPSGSAKPKHAAWPFGDDRQRATLGIAAEQRSLRAFQNLDPFDVEQRGVETVLATQINTIDIDADPLFAGGLIGVERNNAANADGQGCLSCIIGRDAQARHCAVAKVEQALDVTIPQRFAIDHVDGYRRFLQTRLALCRGDDNVSTVSI